MGRRQNGRYFADTIFKYIISWMKILFLYFEVSPKFDCIGPIKNKVVTP